MQLSEAVAFEGEIAFFDELGHLRGSEKIGVEFFTLDQRGSLGALLP